jgi:transposase
VLYLQQYQLLPDQRTAEAMREFFGCRLSAGTAELNEERKSWAEPLRELLLEMKAAVELAGQDGGRNLAAEEQAGLLHRYDELVSKGLAVNPAEANTAAESPSASAAEASQAAGCQKQARNLLLRMQRKREEALRFMTDFSVPFDNNQAERELRMVKLQQKTSGCFRSEEGARRFCRIRSYVSTMRKLRKSVLTALPDTLLRTPLSLRKRAG